MNNLYEIKIRRTKRNGEDNPTNVKETHVYKGASFSDAEARINLSLANWTIGDIEILSMKKVAPHDILPPQTDNDKIFKCKAALIIVDCDKETRKPVFFYVFAVDIETARRRMAEYLVKNYDAELLSVEETKIASMCSTL